MKTLRLGALLAVLLATAARLLAQRAGAQPGGPLNPAPGTLIFSYSEARITDDQRARLVDLLPVIYPTEQWLRIPSQENESLPGFIGRVFRAVGAAPAGPGQRVLPRTVAALINQIRRVNGDVSVSGALGGQSLRVPPMPPVGGSITPELMQWETPSRLWTTVNGGEAWKEEAMTDVSLAGRAGYSMLAGISSDASAGAVRALAEIGTLGVADGAVRLNMPKSSGACQPAESWVTASPYFARAQAQVAKEKAGILRRAAEEPLVILDFNFNGGHGAEVVSAAATLLEAIGIPELVPFIHRIELNPAANGKQSRDDLRELFIEYLKEYGAANGVVGIIRAQALDWIDLNDTGSDRAAATIDNAVLQAALWKAVQISPWLNISWWTQRQAVIYPAGWSALVNRRGTFGVVAAGNDGQELPVDLEPQQRASISPTWLNVTFGSRDGTVGTGRDNGNRTRVDRGAFVDTIGPGCGFARPPLTSGDRGSSYASPFVAAAAWLKHLLDGTPSTEMRERIWLASPMIPRQPFPAESNGVFEAARLLSDIGPHLVTTGPASKIVEFKQATIQDTLCGTYDSRTSRQATLALSQTAAGYTLFIRLARPGVPGGEVRTCIIDPKNFTIEIDGAKPPYDAPGFVKAFREIVF